MFFALLVLASAFLIEAIGTYVSVIGLSSIFAANPVIITLAIALDIGKVVSVSFLYKYWKNVNILMKTYMTAAALVLMLITSAGAFGFLSGEFQHAIASTNQNGVILTSLTDEQGRLQKRKEEIDKQIAQLPENNVRGRTQLMRNFDPEVKRINDRLAEIDKQLPQLKVDNIKKNVEVGPIIYIAEAFNTTPEHAVKWVILIIIFVFDPLAIALLLAGNYLLALPKEEKPVPKVEEVKVEPPAPPPIVEPIVEEPKVEELVVTVPEPVEEVKEPEQPTDTAKVVIESLPEYEVVWTPEDEARLDQAIADHYGQHLEEAVEQAIEDGIGEVRPEEPVQEEPIEEPVEDEREIITIEKLTGPKVKQRSSLEDFDGGQSDVVMNHERIMTSRATAHYQDRDAVTVGGPSGRATN